MKKATLCYCLPTLALFLSMIGADIRAQPSPRPGLPMGGPPPGAMEACRGKQAGSPCSFQAPQWTVSGICRTRQNRTICVPDRGPESQNARRSNSGSKQLMDVHGAGAQRSDPKKGNPDLYAGGHGPQGDVVSIYNFVRCVRGASGRSNSYPVVDTGQTGYYSDRGELSAAPEKNRPFYGQDAQYAGLAPAYRDNGDHTVTDLNTGLMWQQNFSQVKWRNAAAAAARDRTAGYTDWRVPTIKELYSLIDFNGSTGSAAPEADKAPGDAVPYINTKYFTFEYPTANRYIDAQFISSTSFVGLVMGNREAFFGVNFADGRIKGYPQTGNPKRRSYYIRFVRGNPNYGRNDFHDNSDKTIADRATGLVWMQEDHGKVNWQQALAYCEDLSLAGNNDWRLPDAKELQSIVDYSRSPDTSNSAAIDPLFRVTAIADPEGNRNYPYYWTSTTHLDGRIRGEWAVYIAFGRAAGFMSRPSPMP